MNFRRFDGAALVYFILITIWLTWPLTPRLSTGMSSAADPLLNLWALGWSYHILPSHPLSLFDANIFAPRPDTLAYSEHLFGTVLLVAPVYLATGNLVLAYNAAFFLSFVLSGLGMYLLTRELSGNRWAALAAGTIYLAAPYRFGHLLQLQLLSLQWLPFVFWCLLRFLRAGRVSSLAGVVLFSLLQILSCNYYAVYLAYAVAIFGAAIVLFGRERLSIRKIVLLVGGAGVVSALALPFILPYQRNRERGFYRRYEDVVHFSASLADYFTPSSFNKAPHLRYLPLSTRSEKALFLGFGALALVALGLARRGGCPRAFWIFVIALSGSAIVLSLGPELRWGERTIELPYRFFYRHVPGFSGLRVPARISVLALFGVAVLAGLGAAWTLGKARRFESIAGAGLLGLLLFEYQTYSLERVLPPALEIARGSSLACRDDRGRRRAGPPHPRGGRDHRRIPLHVLLDLAFPAARQRIQRLVAERLLGAGGTPPSFPDLAELPVPPRARTGPLRRRPLRQDPRAAPPRARGRHGAIPREPSRRVPHG
jgi:hypothetical protein